ncbi:hypothetical protein L915_03011, partial [Phytophthora nicotianae]
WLVRVQNIVSTSYGEQLGFINLCETRWNSMQGCFASSLRVRTSLLQFVILYGNGDDFPQPLHVFGGSDFWRKLSAAEEVIRPFLTFPTSYNEMKTHSRMLWYHIAIYV